MENRHLLWFGAAFFLAAFIPAICVSLFDAIVASVVLLSIIVFMLTKPGLRRCAVIVAGAVTVSVAWQMFYFAVTKPPSNMLKSEIEVIAEATSYSERNSKDSGIVVKVKVVEKEKTGSRPIRALLYINDVGYSLSPGDKVHAVVEVKEPENTAEFAAETYYRSRYTDTLAFARRVTEIEENDSFKVKYIPQYLGKRLSNKFDEIYPQETAAFMKSLIMGDDSELSPSFAFSLRRSGMLHTISVSGMHISFLIGFLIIFTKNKYLRLLAIPIIFLFTLMVGAPQSALRAAIMQTLLILSTVSKREYDPLTSLAASALVLVILNPYCASDRAFLLSFAATLGIIVLAPVLNSGINSFARKRGRICKRFLAYMGPLASTSVAASVFTAPILSASFGYISLIAPASNILLSFIITFSFIIGIISAVFGFIFMPVAKVGAFAVTGLYEIVNYGVRALSRVPFAEIYTGSSISIILICFLCFTAVFAIAFGKSKVRPGIAAAVILIAVGASFAASAFIKPKEPGDGIRFDVLDVGQGQCVVAETQDMCVVIDCGGNSNAGSVATEHIRKRGIDEIDALILTHAHSDHANGAGYLMKSIPTKAVYAPAADMDDALLSSISETATDMGTETNFIEENTDLLFSDANIKLFTLPRENTHNENGLVVLISDGDFDLIVTGDIPHSAEKVIADREELPDCEAYIVGHHGSSTSSSQAFLNEILPEVSIISVGAGNIYNHPTDEVLKRLTNIGSDIYRTDKQGSITLYSEQ